MKSYTLLFVSLFLWSSALISYPVRYIELVNPQTKQHVHVIGDIHIERRRISNSENDLIRVIEKSDEKFSLHILIEKQINESISIKYPDTFFFLDQMGSLLVEKKLKKTKMKPIDYRLYPLIYGMMDSYFSAGGWGSQDTVPDVTFKSIYDAMLSSMQFLEKQLNNFVRIDPEQAKLLQEDLKVWWEKFRTGYFAILTQYNAQESSRMYDVFVQIMEDGSLEMIKSLLFHMLSLADLGFLYEIILVQSDCIVYVGDVHARKVAETLQKKFGYSKIREISRWFELELPPQTWQYIYKDHEMIQTYKMREAAALAR